MVEWSTNEPGTVHYAQGVVRCSRFLREARIIRILHLVLEGQEITSHFEVSIYAKTDMDAPINAGLEPKTTIMDVKQFTTLSGAKAWAETWLQH